MQWTEYAARSGDPHRQVLVARTHVTVGGQRIVVSAQTFVPAAREAMIHIASSVQPAP